MNLNRSFPEGIGSNDSTKYMFNGGHCAVGSILPGGFPFSTRYLHCPWIAKGHYGTEALRVAQEWEEVRDTPTESGWGRYFGEDTSGLSTAFAAAGGPVPLVAGPGNSVDLLNFCQWLIGEFDARGEWPTEAAARAQNPNWVGRLAAARPVAERFAPLLPPLYRRHNAYFHRKQLAEEQDRAFANSLPNDDGPAIRVVACERASGFEEDPQCFAGAYWIAVVPVPA